MNVQSHDRHGFLGPDANVTKWLRASTTADRFAMVAALNEMGRRIVAEEIRDSHPEWSDQEISAELARRFLADDNLPELYAKDLISIEPFATAYRSACSLGVSNSGVAGSD